MELLDKSQMPWMNIAETAAEEAEESNARFVKGELPWHDAGENHPNVPFPQTANDGVVDLGDYEDDYAVATRAFVAKSVGGAVLAHDSSPLAHIEAFEKVYDKIAETRTWVDQKVKPFPYIQEVNEFGQTINRINADLTAVVDGIPVEILTMDKAGIVDAPTIRINSHKISALEGRADADEERISANEEHLAVADQQIDSLHQTTIELSEADATINGELSEFKTNAETKFAQIDAAFETQYSTNASLSATDTALGGRIDELSEFKTNAEAKFAQIDAAFETQYSTNASLSATDTALGGRIDEMGADIATEFNRQAAKNESLESADTALGARIDDVSAELSAHEHDASTRFAGIDGAIASHSVNIQSLEGDISSISGNIDNLEREINTVDGVINDINVAITGIRSTVAGLNSGLQNIVTQFTGHETYASGKFAAIEGRLNSQDSEITRVSTEAAAASSKAVTALDLAQSASDKANSVAGAVHRAEVAAAAAESMANAAQTAAHGAVVATQTFGDDLEQAKDRITALEQGGGGGGSKGGQYVTANVGGANFSTKSALTGASVYYHFGTTHIPQSNDYAVVLSDETHAQDGNGRMARYVFNGSTWVFQYLLDNVSLTPSEQKILAEGVTEDELSTGKHYKHVVSELTNGYYPIKDYCTNTVNIDGDMAREYSELRSVESGVKVGECVFNGNGSHLESVRVFTSFEDEEWRGFSREQLFENPVPDFPFYLVSGVAESGNLLITIEFGDGHALTLDSGIPADDAAVDVRYVNEGGVYYTVVKFSKEGNVRYFIVDSEGNISSSDNEPSFSGYVDLNCRVWIDSRRYMEMCFGLISLTCGYADDGGPYAGMTTVSTAHEVKSGYNTLKLPNSLPDGALREFIIGLTMSNCSNPVSFDSDSDTALEIVDRHGIFSVENLDRFEKGTQYFRFQEFSPSKFLVDVIGADEGGSTIRDNLDMECDEEEFRNKVAVLWRAMGGTVTNDGGAV